MTDQRQGEPTASDGTRKGEPDKIEPLETILDLEPTEEDADHISGGKQPPPHPPI
jgi:hypothetical protein